MGNKTKRIDIRVTEDEHRKIKEEAEKNFTTMSALLLSRFERSITINLDTSVYKDLVIEFKRIGNNINQILRRINETGYYTKSQFELIKNYQEELEREINNQGRIIRKQKRSLEEIRPRELINHLTKEGKATPNFLIEDLIVEDINIKLSDIFELGKKEEVSSILLTTIDLFLERFIPSEYSYDELVNFSNDLSEVSSEINGKIVTGKNQFDQDDLNKVREVLIKHLKKEDD